MFRDKSNLRAADFDFKGRIWPARRSLPTSVQLIAQLLIYFNDFFMIFFSEPFIKCTDELFQRNLVN